MLKNVLTVKIDDETRERIDSIYEALRQRWPRYIQTRSDAVRELLQRGLDSTQLDAALRRQDTDTQ